ncbi:chaplin [Streptomyces sp. NPDC001770]
MSKLRSTVFLAAAAAALTFAGAGTAAADAGAQGAAFGSPGVLSGNVVQIPVHIPVNVCGNSLNIIGLLNPSFGNSCVNGGSHDRGHDETKDGHEGYSGDHGK